MKKFNRLIAIFFIWFFIISFLIVSIKIDIKKDYAIQKNDSTITIFIDNEKDYKKLISKKSIKYNDIYLKVIASNKLDTKIFSITVNFYQNDYYENTIKLVVDSKNIISFILNW